MNNEKIVKADFVSSLVIILFSLMEIYISFRMPTYEEWGLYATPSLAPIVFGFILLFCGIFLFVRSTVKGGYRISIRREDVLRVYHSRAVTHFFVVLGLVILYYLLLGKVHFMLISGAYIFFNIFYFKSTALWKNLLISIITSAVIWYLFDQVLLIPLP